MEHSIQTYQRLGEQLAACLAATESPWGLGRLRLWENRCACSVEHLRAIEELEAIAAFTDDAHPERLGEAEKAQVRRHCAQALAHSQAYQRLHLEEMPDRGCQGTLVSYWAAIPVYIDHVLKYFAEGERVKGWWIDGCYYPDAMYNFPDEPNFKSFAAAIRAGNPQAVVAFNRGLEDPFLPQCPWEDYTAGEVGDWLPIPGQKVRERLQGKKLHVLSYLGQTWGQGQPRFPDELVAGYTKLILAQDGILTWDIPLEPNGAIPQAYRRQLQALGRMLEE